MSKTPEELRDIVTQIQGLVLNDLNPTPLPNLNTRQKKTAKNIEKFFEAAQGAITTLNQKQIDKANINTLAKIGKQRTSRQNTELKTLKAKVTSTDKEMKDNFKGAILKALGDLGIGNSQNVKNEINSAIQGDSLNFDALFNALFEEPQFKKKLKETKLQDVAVTIKENAEKNIVKGTVQLLNEDGGRDGESIAARLEARLTAEDKFIGDKSVEITAKEAEVTAKRAEIDKAINQDNRDKIKTTKAELKAIQAERKAKYNEEKGTFLGWENIAHKKTEKENKEREIQNLEKDPQTKLIKKIDRLKGELKTKRIELLTLEKEDKKMKDVQERRRKGEESTAEKTPLSRAQAVMKPLLSNEPAIEQIRQISIRAQQARDVAAVEEAAARTEQEREDYNEGIRLQAKQLVKDYDDGNELGLLFEPGGQYYNEDNTDLADASMLEFNEKIAKQSRAQTSRDAIKKIQDTAAARTEKDYKSIDYKAIEEAKEEVGGLAKAETAQQKAIREARNRKKKKIVSTEEPKVDIVGATAPSVTSAGVLARETMEKFFMNNEGLSYDTFGDNLNSSSIQEKIERAVRSHLINGKPLNPNMELLIKHWTNASFDNPSISGPVDTLLLAAGIDAKTVNSIGNRDNTAISNNVLDRVSTQAIEREGLEEVEYSPRNQTRARHYTIGGQRYTRGPRDVIEDSLGETYGYRPHQGDVVKLNIRQNQMGDPGYFEREGAYLGPTVTSKGGQPITVAHKPGTTSGTETFGYIDPSILPQQVQFGKAVATSSGGQSASARMNQAINSAGFTQVDLSAPDITIKRYGEQGERFRPPSPTAFRKGTAIARGGGRPHIQRSPTGEIINVIAPRVDITYQGMTPSNVRAQTDPNPDTDDEN